MTNNNTTSATFDIARLEQTIARQIELADMARAADIAVMATDPEADLYNAAAESANRFSTKIQTLVQIQAEILAIKQGY